MSNMSLSDENTQTGLLSANLPQDFFRPMHSPPQGRSQGHSAAVARFSAAADEAALVEARQNSAFTQQPTFPTADQGAMAPYGHQQQMNAQRSNAYNMQYGAAPRIHPAYRYPGYQPWDHPEIPISQGMSFTRTSHLFFVYNLSPPRLMNFVSRFDQLTL